ncbi:hypothetical protein IV102_07870 [bacterium]|nr:hypothetical protein [bacterium]
MMGRWRSRLGLTLAGLCLVGCHLTWVRPVSMDMKLTNDRNELLTVEGNCTLPDGAVMEAHLLEKNGRRWAYARGVVKNGRYFVVLEVSRCPGFRPLNLDVFFDPLLASAEVQRITGERGEALRGEQLVESHDRTLLLLHQSVVLTMSARQVAIRRLQSGDGDIDELQSYLVRHPNDGESMIGLGLAFLKQRPSQHYVNSEAYKMLQEGIKNKPAAGSLEMEARLWVARLDEKAAREAAERERQKAPAYSSRYVDDVLVWPGQSLGAFQLGMGYQFLCLSFRLQPTDQAGVYIIHEMPGLKLTFEGGTGSLIRAASQSPRYRTQEGIGPGSDVADVLKLLPQTQIVYSPVEIRQDGRAYANATVPLQGLNLLIEQSYDPNFPIPEQLVKEVEVFKPAP